MRGAAWSAPIVALAAAAPAYAASTCVPVTLTESSFTRTSSGTFQTASSPYADAWQTGRDGVRRYTSWQDNTSKTANATKTMTASIDVIKGRTYTFKFSVIGGFANPWSNSNRNSSAVSLVLGGVTQWTGTTPASPTDAAPGVPIAGAVTVPTTNFLNSTDSQATNPTPGVYTVSYVAAATGKLSVQMLYTLEPRPNNTSTTPSPGVDDIAMSLPTVTCR